MKKKFLSKGLSLTLIVLAVLGASSRPVFGGTAPSESSNVMISAGYMHSVLLKGDGTVWAWGKNTLGQLGDGTNDVRTSPVQVKGLADVVWVDAGGDGNDDFPGHTAAVKKDGTVWCWGANSYGQLGDGTKVSRNRPVKVAGISDAVKVSAGGEFTVALKKDGTVWCWGSNLSGQLGIGGKANSPKTAAKPVQVMNLKNIAAVSAAYSYVLAVDKDGNVWTWGEDISRNPKSSKTIYHTQPVKVPGLSGVTDVGAGMGAIALRKDGTVWCWGDNTYGELGNGSFGWNEKCGTPHIIWGLSKVVSISAGSCNGVAVKSDGTIWTWGDNRSGELGNNSTLDSATPVQVTGLTGVAQAACGRVHTLALKEDGSVWSWGDNWFGQLGDGTEAIVPKPEQVAGIEEVNKIAAGGVHTLALKKDGTVWGWGACESSQLDFQKTWPEQITYKPIRLHDLSHVIDIAAGDDYSLAVKEDGTVWAWGQNYRYQLGDGTTDYREKPVQTKELNDIIQVTASQSNSLALKKDGTVWAWGDNALGYTQTGRTGASAKPVKVSGISNVIAIASDVKYSAALKKDGTVWFWETDYDSSIITMKQVHGIENAVGISCGDQHVSILKKDGTVWSLGNNQAAMLGDGTTIRRNTPVQAKNLRDVRGISSALYYTMAVKNDGTVWHWGNYMFGTSGSGEDLSLLVPVQMKGISGVKAVAAGDAHSVALKEDGTVWCWGGNFFGQSGQDHTNRLKPVQVRGLNPSEAGE